jgi:hypothetical protein
VVETQKRVSFISQKCSASLTHACSSYINEQEKKGSSLWKLEGAMTLEDTYLLPKKATQKKSQCIPEQSMTNFNGDGDEHSQPEKRRVEGHRVVKTPKELVSCHKNASVAEISE